VFIALVRGINVGGATSLARSALLEALEVLGARQVRTYLRSGNAVFQLPVASAAGFAQRLMAAIAERCGLEPVVVLLDLPALEAAVRANPYPRAEDSPTTLHLFFLQAPAPAADLDALESLAGPTEHFALRERVFYLHAPQGIGRSKLAARAERAVGVPMTGRNWRSVQRVLALARDLSTGG
jgi:uncharacterized protein (DUF1697 family)